MLTIRLFRPEKLSEMFQLKLWVWPSFSEAMEPPVRMTGASVSSSVTVALRESLLESAVVIRIRGANGDRIVAQAQGVEVEVSADGRAGEDFDAVAGDADGDGA